LSSGNLQDIGIDMKRIFLALIIIGALVGAMLTLLPKRSVDQTPLARLTERYRQKEKPSADHTLFAALQKPFSKPQEVTEACISCHNERHKEVMKSSHWNWERTEYIEGKGIRKVGKGTY